jgi:FtsZ-binding cell division protein ZapB
MKDNFYLQIEIDNLKTENLKAHEKILHMKKKVEELEEKMGHPNNNPLSDI